MSQDRPSLRSFWLTLAVLWLAMSAAGIIYAARLDLPGRLAAPLLAAFLWEAPFYLLIGFPSMRQAIEEHWTPQVLAAALAVAALVPYSLSAVAAGEFHLAGLGLIASLAGAAAFCYLCLPLRGSTDALFLAFMAGVILSGCFKALYPMPAPRLRLEILGQLMWIRTGILAVLWFRRPEGINVGFWPSRREWAIGVLHFLYFLPVGLPLALGTGLVRFRPPGGQLSEIALIGIGTFLGMLWVVALSEEFFFRGMMQPALSRWLGNRVIGLVVTSVIFGLVHLPFRSFPNWRFALVAAVAGVFYGRAYWQGRGIRAAMVAHALVNTVTRLFFA